MKKHALQLEKTCQISTKWSKSASFIQYFPILTSDIDSSRKMKWIRHQERVSSSIRRASMAKTLFGVGMGIPSVKVQSGRMQIWAWKMANYVSRMHQRALFEVKNRENSEATGGVSPPPFDSPPRCHMFSSRKRSCLFGRAQNRPLF